MQDSAARPAGNIYDLGYRAYEGARLGRRHAFAALFTYSFRAVFGLGRSFWTWAIPIGLSFFASLQALLQLAVAALAPIEFEIVRPETYFAGVEITLGLFCALVAPEIMGRDLRSHALPLYFSRAMQRYDYVTAKLAALVAGLLLILLTPQVILMAGTAVSTEAVLRYLYDHLVDIPPIVGSSIVIAMFMASISIAIASHTSKRALGTGVVLGYFVIFTLVGNILAEIATGDLRAWLILLSPFDVCEGVVYWLFNVKPAPEMAVARAGQSGGFYFLAAVTYTIMALAVLYRRFLRMVV